MSEDVVHDTKPCRKCGREVPLPDYHTDNSQPDGLHRNCPTCVRDYVRAYRATRPRPLTRQQRRRITLSAPAVWGVVMGAVGGPRPHRVRMWKR